MRWLVFVGWLLVLLSLPAYANLWGFLFQPKVMFYAEDINGGNYSFDHIEVNSIDANEFAWDLNTIGDANINGDLNVFGDIGFSGIIYGDGSGLTNLPSGLTWNDINAHMVPYIAATKDVNLGAFGLRAFGDVNFGSAGVLENLFVGDNIYAVNEIWGSYLASRFGGSIDMRADPWELVTVGLGVAGGLRVDGDTNLSNVQADYFHRLNALGDSNVVNLGVSGRLFGDGSGLTGITSVAGSNNQVQYNDNGMLGASQYFTFTDTNNELNLDGLSIFKNEKFYNFNFSAFQYGTETWSVSTEAEFDLGTYSSTDFNAIGGFVGLIFGNKEGDYTSSIYDASLDVEWQTMSWEFKDIDCPTGMSFIPKLNGFCIDQYEASHSDATFCTNDTNWSYPGDCNTHYGASSTPASVADRIPWVTISQTAAATACAAAGKRLCSSLEWMAAANLNGQIYDLNNTTTQQTCIVDSTLYCLDHSETYGEACNTGSNKNTSPSNCKSAQGVYDLIGNVWEWASDAVDVDPDSINGGWQYPNDGNLTSNLWYNQTPSLHYGNDGVYTSSTKLGRAVIRGGSWSNESNAGLFSVGLSTAPSYTYIDIGFRCCKAT